MIGLYREGDSVLHRLPAGAKLLALLLVGVASPFVRSPLVTGGALLVVLAGYAVARMPVRVLLQMLRPLLLVMVPLAIFQTVVAGWQRAVVIVGVLVALVLLANLVTLTTRTTDLIDVVVRVCGPLRRVGVNPERVGLMLQLAIRAVPQVIDLGRRVREAQHARGLAASPRAFAVPLIVGALRRADAMGDALAARGLDD
ncbi:energy-coupling factor transporter transmembrane component T family protein [Janibacter indicus]|uniref:Biotin transport system permease protein n=1 Tax=Janibacter indicus TaxID=857417 RepID=A0A1W1ZX14_9MICO|nr:energy-coupling factor transporter transmembrane component T [Janibacter indicus]SMC52782.1 biotin transport system permease protein [Janibacter indicus]